MKQSLDLVLEAACEFGVNSGLVGKVTDKIQTGDHYVGSTKRGITFARTPAPKAFYTLVAWTRVPRCGCS